MWRAEHSVLVSRVGIRLLRKQRNAVGGVTFALRIVDGDSRELIFGNTELQRGTVHARRQSGESHLAVVVRVGLEVKPAYAPKTVSDMHLHIGNGCGFSVRGHA